MTTLIKASRSGIIQSQNQSKMQLRFILYLFICSKRKRMKQKEKGARAHTHNPSNDWNWNWKRHDHTQVLKLLEFLLLRSLILLYFFFLIHSIMKIVLCECVSVERWVRPSRLASIPRKSLTIHFWFWMIFNSYSLFSHSTVGNDIQF